MKKLGLATVALSVLLLSGCGGGGSKSTGNKSTIEKMKEKTGIIITHNYPDEVCKSQRLKNELAAEGLTDIITSIEDNSVSCQTYGRANNGAICIEQTLGGYPNACVIGANTSSSVAIDTATMMAITPDTLLKTL